MGNIPSGYENITAGNVNIKESIYPLINEADIFVLIIGDRYGTITDSEKSYIEEEYNYALLKKKYILCFIKSDYMKNDDMSYQSFVKRLLTNHMVAFWESPDEFRNKLQSSIYTTISRNPPDTYWIKHSKLKENAKSDIDKYFSEVIDVIGLDKNEDADILGLMALNLKEIKEFYTLTKKQAIKAFNLSVFMCIAGFLLFALSVAISLVWHYSQIAITTAIGGAVVEIVAGTSLLVYRKALGQLNFYYSSLHDNERYMSLINVAAKTDTKNELYSKIVTSELERLKLSNTMGNMFNKNVDE
jgi:multimeric flavodoxin WrbA